MIPAMIKDPFQRLNLDREILSVSQLNGRARVLLEDVFAQVWVEGEISNLAKPAAGHLAKAGVEAGEITQEFRVGADIAGKYAAGASLPLVDIFAVGQKVDVQGTSIGKGYAGTIKRHNFSSQRASHGNSRSHNVPGSIGMAQDPGRVFPGKRMTGHMGDRL